MKSLIDYDKLEKDIYHLLSVDALTYYAESIKIDISEDYKNLWKNLFDNGLIMMSGKDFKLSQECGIAFGKNTQLFCDGALVQLQVEYSKDNIFNKTNKDIELKREYNGPMIMILDVTFEWLHKHFQRTQDRSNKKAVEDFIVPFESIREAVVNAVVHRDYGDNGCFSYIKIKDDHLSIENPCDLPKQRIKKMKNFTANSTGNNSKLSKIFMGTKLQERSGNGMKTFRKTSPTPQYDYDGDFVYLKFAYSEENAYELFVSLHEDISRSVFKTYEYILHNGEVSRANVQSDLDLPEKTANNHLKKLVDIGEIKKVGAGKNTRYTLK